ncbi:MAG: hypothetical protein L3J59_03670 [Methylococcaceae bacterium]|nr:hypothetical protein [Methylococcaceae bacterium]
MKKRLAIIIVILTLLVILVVIPIPHGGTIGGNFVESVSKEIGDYFSLEATNARKKEQEEWMFQKEKAKESWGAFEKGNSQFIRAQPIHVVKTLFEKASFKTTGYVVLKYVCPECPAGATCKRCMRNNIIISEKPNLLESYSFVGKNELVLFYKNTEKLILGKAYLFYIKSVNNELQLITYQIIK